MFQTTNQLHVVKMGKFGNIGKCEWNMYFLSKYSGTLPNKQVLIDDLAYLILI